MLLPSLYHGAGLLLPLGGHGGHLGAQSAEGKIVVRPLASATRDLGWLQGVLSLFLYAVVSSFYVQLLEGGLGGGGRGFPSHVWRTGLEYSLLNAIKQMKMAVGLRAGHCCP